VPIFTSIYEDVYQVQPKCGLMLVKTSVCV